jgi:hypothetical protein
LLELYNRGKPDEMITNKQLNQQEIMILRHWEKEVVDAVSRLAAMGARFAEQYTSAEAAITRGILKWLVVGRGNSLRFEASAAPLGDFWWSRGY